MAHHGLETDQDVKQLRWDGSMSSESEPVEHPPCSAAQLPEKPVPWSGQRTNG